MAKDVASRDYDVSIVFNAHREGRAMQPTVRSLAFCIDHALRHGLTVELIIVLDRPDALTKKYVKQNLPSLVNDKVPVRVQEVDFGDLGLARNHGAQLAQGRWVGVLDADDIVAENLITASVKMVNKHQGAVIVHPQYIVSFGMRNEVWCLGNSNAPDFDKAGIVEYNPWPSPSFTTKEIRDKYPYKATHAGDGFGPEDWQWNVDTLGAGIEHVCAPQTAYFYRRKITGSLAVSHSELRSLLYKTELLYDQTLVPLGTTEQTKISLAKRPKTPAQILSVIPRLILKKFGRIVGPLFRYGRRTQAFEHYMRIAFRELLSPSMVASQPSVRSRELPSWLIQEWHKQHNFEHNLFPEPDLVHNLPEYRPAPSSFTAIYWSLLKKLPLDADFVFIIPWLKMGGADLVVLNYIEGILKLKPDARIVVLATEPTDSPWRDRLPKMVPFITLDQAFHSLDPERQARLLGTLLVQTSPKHIHLINAPVGFRTFTDYAKPLSKTSHLFVSAFNVDHTPLGRRAHSILDHLSYSIDYVQKVLTDNRRIIDELVLLQAMPREKFRVNYQPYSGTIIEPRKIVKEFTATRPLRVLWAGRLDRQKRPDILMKIAEKTRALNMPIEFHVYGNQVLNKDNTIEQLLKHPNITYHGGFNKGLGALPLKNFDLYLTTAEYEGLPNILLEATGGGLPIVAPAVGGIPEFIQSGRTGCLISAYDDVGQYVAALERCLRNPAEAQSYLRNAQMLLTTRHSWEEFEEELKREGSYVEVGAAATKKRTPSVADKNKRVNHEKNI